MSKVNTKPSKATLDPGQIAPLPLLDTAGVFPAEQIASFGTMLKYAKLSGQWYALNHRSMDPVNMANREMRACFARVIGARQKDVENYVRREKARKRRESQNEEVQEAIELLVNNGFKVERDGP